MTVHASFSMAGMDDLYTRAYLETRKSYKNTSTKPPTPQQHKRRPSFGRRSSSVPSKDRKKPGESRDDANDPQSPSIPELDGNEVAFDNHKVMIADPEGPLSRKHKRGSPTTPTTPKSPEIKFDIRGRSTFPKTKNDSNPPEEGSSAFSITSQNSSGDLRPPSSNQLSIGGATLTHKTSSDTHISNATTIAPNYIHEREPEPDSPTLPAFHAMPNPKVISSTPRSGLALITPNFSAQGSSSGGISGTGLPIYPISSERGSPGSILTITRRKSSRTPSSAVSPSPNPFLMRDLPDSFRDLVLDQGLHVRLRDGTAVEMNSDDIQSAKEILSAWNIYEGHLGGGISHEKAYLCMHNSKLPSQILADIWDTCQTIVDPPMPHRVNHSLFPQEFMVAISMIQKESRLDMASLQLNLTAKSPLMSQRKTTTSNILINGSFVPCPNDATAILQLLGARDSSRPPQILLDQGLYIAASKGFRSAVAWFLDRNADVDSLNAAANRKPLHASCENGHEDVTRILLQRQASVNVKDDDGKTPLHLAAADGNDGIIRMLIQAGADLNAIDDDGDLPLHKAADSGNPKIMPLFMRARVKVDTLGAGKRSALMRAVEGGHKATVRYLLDERANVNLRDEIGWTSLHCAVRNGNDTMTNILLEEGANIHERANDEQTALCMAVQFDIKVLVRLLVKNGALISDYGANGMAPIHIAAVMGKERMLSTLLDLGAMINNYTRGSAINSQTALMLAIIQQHEGIVKILLNHPKISLEAEDRNRSTAMHYAVQKGNVPIIKLLLDKGVRLDDMNIDGKAPIDLAKDKEVKDLLKQAAKNYKIPRKFSLS